MNIVKILFLTFDYYCLIICKTVGLMGKNVFRIKHEPNFSLEILFQILFLNKYSAGSSRKGGQRCM
jgi:hypothetical protein